MVARMGVLKASVAGAPGMAGMPPRVQRGQGGEATGKSHPGLEPFDRMMLRFLRDTGVPGVSLALARQGRLVYARGFGLTGVEAGQPVRPRSLFRVASVRPIAIAEEEKVTPPAGPRVIFDYMMMRPLDLAPGERFAYSNFVYCALGLVIEAAAGVGGEQFVRRRVLGPMGISEMRIGRTLAEQRAAGEVRYYAELRLRLERLAGGRAEAAEHLAHGVARRHVVAARRPPQRPRPGRPLQLEEADRRQGAGRDDRPPLIHEAADAVRSWPDIDLFRGSSVGTGGQGSPSSRLPAEAAIRAR